ncbi:MAG: hypothetical protein P8L20_00880 [Flavobacteriales bacterium]|nr:hypothetical protein [Flavobacteriales bacterium]
MDNKIQNIVLKSVMGLIIFLGTLFTVWVVMSGDPGNMSDVELEQLAIQKAKAENLQNSMSQIDLDQWLRDTAKEIKIEKEKTTFSAVSLVIDFTQYIFYFTILLVVASVGYLFTVDAKKAAINIAGIIGVVGFIFIIYATAGSDVPQEYVAAETLKGVADEDRSFTEGNWQFASAALTSTIILVVVALLGWIGGTVMKMFK